VCAVCGTISPLPWVLGISMKANDCPSPSYNTHNTDCEGSTRWAYALQLCEITNKRSHLA
jgi:hypothetical protein